MSDGKSRWTPEDEETIKDLIRATIKNAGADDPALLPSKVREQIKSRIKDDVDVDAYVKRVLAEQQKG